MVLLLNAIPLKLKLVEGRPWKSDGVYLCIVILMWEAERLHAMTAPSQRGCCSIGQTLGRWQHTHTSHTTHNTSTLWGGGEREAVRFDAVKLSQVHACLLWVLHSGQLRWSLGQVGSWVLAEGFFVSFMCFASTWRTNNTICFPFWAEQIVHNPGRLFPVSSTTLWVFEGCNCNFC